MFSKWSSLINLKLGKNLKGSIDLRGKKQQTLWLNAKIESLISFNTSNVTDMRLMFQCCLSLTSLDLSSFDFSNMKELGNMP